MLYNLKNISSQCFTIFSVFLVITFNCYAKSTNLDNKKIFPSIWNVASSNEYFVGRKIMLSNIHNNFRNNQKVISLVGSSGIGKTQLAKRYAEIYKQDYDIIWWIDSDKIN
jgi:ABC-type polysaccharide/polyol phosphate transport system ATPase subunit